MVKNLQSQNGAFWTASNVTEHATKTALNR